MRPDDNLVLTGFMATGKTTVGRRLAEKLGLEFVDTDDLIESRHGPVPQIFEQQGEAWFRSVERAVAVELGAKTGLVIATGGRMLLDPENLRSLSRHGRIFCLVATPGEIQRRVAHDATRRPRPLLDADDPRRRIDELMTERERQYRRFPQLTTDHVGPETIVDEIVELWNGPRSFDVMRPSGGYRFTVGAGILPFVDRLASIDGPTVVVTDGAAGSLFTPSLGDVDLTVVLPSDRVGRTPDAVQWVHDHLAAAEIDESATIVSLGGRIIADVAGLVAATHLGGLDVVHCPTDLMAMLDTSVGGRVAPDSPDLDLIEVAGQPKAIIAETATLQNLSWRDFSSGLAELIEHGLVGSRPLLDTIHRATWSPGRSLQSGMLSDLESLVAQAIQVKIAVAREESFEEGRTVLNVGHTLAAGIERASDGVVNHGEAVAIGLVAAARLSHIKGFASVDLPDRVVELVSHVGLAPELGDTIDPVTVLDGIRHDQEGRHFVLLRDVADPFITEDVTDAEVLEALRGDRRGP